ncbi:MAG: SpoIIE family protein phosphatase [Actinomycetota bacterium]|nr:SpoIIE family protein phosphatase [Actinomycetota bacterium]
MTGYPSEDCLGRKCSFLQDSATDSAELQRLREALAAQRDVQVTLRNRRKDGAVFWNELRVVPLREEGRLRYVLGFQLDVTHTVETVRRLREVISEQERELTELRAVREALTPPPTLAHGGLDVATAFVAAESGVAGDFFLAAPSPRDSITLAVGDAVGHGLRAAKQASFVRTSLSTFAGFTDDPQRLLELANYSLIERTGGSADFVTCVCVNLRPGAGELVVASAGHPPPLRLDDAAPVPPAAQGLPLGTELELRGRQAVPRLAPGDGLLLFSDGLPEARSARGPAGAQRFGDDRVAAGVRELRGEPAQRVIEGLLAEVRRAVDGPLQDDLCAGAVRRRGDAA